jgi:uncharacterized protein (TIGR03067 family)
MKRLSLCFVAVALLSTAACSRLRPAAATPAPPPDLAKVDLEKLQGTWRIEASWWNGAPEPDVARSVTILFQDDKFIVVDRDGNRMEETIKLMPEENPKAIDCSSKGAGGRATLGIYSLEGDVFRWCSVGGGSRVRPTAFASEPGSRHSLMVLRRVKH